MARVALAAKTEWPCSGGGIHVSVATRTVEVTNRNTRRSPRYPFVATAEIVEEGSSSIMMARLGDLSLHGCYIHMSKPLQKGASISIRIAVGNSVFQARGTVVHFEPNAGVGVEFQEIEPSYLAVLEEWLLEAKNLNTIA